jgi:DNA repair exonuclease SbcCD ATPase subunit
MLAEDLTNTCTMQELKDRLREFDEGAESKIQKKNALEDKLSDLQRQIEMCRNKKSQIQSDIGRFQAEKAAHERNLAIRFERMVEIGAKYGLEEVVTQINQNSQVSNNAQSQNASYMSQFDTSSYANSTVTMSQAGSPMLDISTEDMESFWRAVFRKEEDLETELKSQKQKRTSQEDNIAKELAQLMGKFQSIQNEHKQIQLEDKELRSELEKLRSQHTGQKLRKTALVEAEADAAKAVKERNDANKNPRMKQIPTEIKFCKAEADKLTQKISIEKRLLEELRKQTEKRNKIELNKDVCKKDLADLHEAVDDDRLELMRFRVDQPPKELPDIDNDPYGEKLKELFEKVYQDVEEQATESEGEHEKAQNQVQELETFIAEKKALLNHDEEMLKTKQRDLHKTEQSLEIAGRIHKEVRDFELNQDETTPVNLDLAENADQLMDHINKRIEEQEDNSLDGVTSKVLKKVIKGIYNHSKKQRKCICCDRDIRDDDEKKAFSRAMNILAGNDETESSPLFDNINDGNLLEMKTKYETWRDNLKPHMRNLTEHKRIKGEVRELDENTKVIRGELVKAKENLKDKQHRADSAFSELKDLRTLLGKTEGWRDAAIKISFSRSAIKRSEDDLKLELVGDKSGRRLEEVEQNVEVLQTQKENKNNEVRMTTRR